MTAFKKLTTDWNAEPNAPMPQITFWDRDIVLSFYLNAFAYPEFKEGDIGQLRFRNCWRYRLGPVNDEGWYRGQCRFSKKAPAWGQFYEVSGDLILDACPKDWKEVSWKDDAVVHYLFYFRDGQFECDAASYNFAVLK
jgi:hypothetical protein